MERADQLPPSEQFNLALQWFIPIIRHLNVGISRAQNGRGQRLPTRWIEPPSWPGLPGGDAIVEDKDSDRPSPERLLEDLAAKYATSKVSENLRTVFFASALCAQLSAYGLIVRFAAKDDCIADRS